MRVGLIGTGSIAHKHAQAYQNIGFKVTACASFQRDNARRFADQYGAEFMSSFEDLCRRSDVDFVDVCTFPAYRLQAVQLCAGSRKHIQVQKPIALDLETARQMIDVARRGGILLSVVSQHRFDDASQFLKHALDEGRLGKLLQCDCSVKWYRSDEYYSRPEKGRWTTEGGGALINQAIHQVDLLRWLAGPIHSVYGEWQLGALHTIESEDVVSAVVRYSSGATGVIQASTAFCPGYPERLELYGTKGSAAIVGDRLAIWDVKEDYGPPPPQPRQAKSGASDAMAISLEPFERQFLDFADAINDGRQPTVSGVEGLQALEVVDAIYRSCRTQQKVILEQATTVA